MNQARRLRPQVDSLETLTLLSAVTPLGHAAAEHSSVAHHVKAQADSSLLDGTLNGTYFAHGNATTQTVFTYSLFASGKLPKLGPVLVTAGFQTAGARRAGADRGSMSFVIEASGSANLFVRLTTLPNPARAGSLQQTLAYQITGGSGPFTHAHGAGTVQVTLRPINTNIHGQPTTSPGFFGNSTLTFRPNS